MSVRGPCTVAGVGANYTGHNNSGTEIVFMMLMKGCMLVTIIKMKLKRNSIKYTSNSNSHVFLNNNNMIQG